MAQRVEHHPLDVAFAALLNNGLDGALLFHLISQFYEKTSLIITTNLSFGEWVTVFGDPKITITPTPDTVVAQISNLPKLGMAEIKSLWRRLFGGDTPTHNRQFLERRIAYKLQIIECRKTDRNLLERNQRRIDNLLEIGKQKSQTRSADYALPPGTVLCRHYQGVDHEVVVQADDTFLYDGQPYTSLSQLAREITGTRWSGPVFFGLKTNVRPKKSATKGGRR